MRNAFARIGVMAMLLLSYAGCDDAATNQSAPPIRTAKSIEAPKEDTAAAKQDAAGATERTYGGATFQVPNVWREEPLDDVGFKVIDADFRIAGEAGEARLTLSSSGGGVAENIDRWKGQFQQGPNDPEPRESTITAAGREATLVELFGTFRDGFRGGDPQPDSAMLGIMIPIPEQRHYILKLTGPRETVMDAKDEILKLAETARFRE